MRADRIAFIVFLILFAAGAVYSIFSADSGAGLSTRIVSSIAAVLVIAAFGAVMFGFQRLNDLYFDWLKQILPGKRFVYLFAICFIISVLFVGVVVWSLVGYTR